MHKHTLAPTSMQKFLLAHQCHTFEADVEISLTML